MMTFAAPTHLNKMNKCFLFCILGEDKLIREDI